MDSATYNNAIPAFIADPGFVRREPLGRQVKWAAVDAAFEDAETGKKRLPAGTVVSVLADGKLIPYGGTDASASPDETPTTAIGLLASEANEDAGFEAKTGYGVITAGVIWENLLPDATGGPPAELAAGTKTALVNGGAEFQFHPYVDSRAD